MSATLCKFAVVVHKLLNLQTTNARPSWKCMYVQGGHNLPGSGVLD